MENKKLKSLILISTISFFSFILWIIYLANTGSKSVFFQMALNVPYGDKLGHIFLYGILAFGVSLALNFRAKYIKGIKLYYGVLIVAAFAFIEELTQAFYPNRTLDVYDLLADVIGLVLFSILLNIIEKKIKGTK